jgi:hypothetical protein
MNFDQSLHQKNIVRNTMLRCALPVFLLALLTAFAIYWTDQAIDCLLAIGSFILKWLATFYWNTKPLVDAIQYSAFWQGVVEYFLLPIRPIVFPLGLAMVCGSMICGCAINKLKLRNITDFRFERLVTAYRPITIASMGLITLSMLAEGNFNQGDLTRIFKVLVLVFACALLNLTLHRVTKLNGDLYRKGRRNGL